MRRVVIFDIDGTLLEGKAEADAFVKTCEICYGITGINTNWSSYQSPTDEGIASEILSEHFARPCRDSEVKKVMNNYMLLLQGIVPALIPGVKQVLEILSKREDVGLALATGNWELAAKFRLEKAGIWEYFQCGTFAEDGNNKTAILGEVLKRCRKVWPDLKRNRDIIYVGDHRGDANDAQTHNINFIGITQNKEQFNGLAIDYIYQDYLDLNSFIDSLERLWNKED